MGPGDNPALAWVWLDRSPLLWRVGTAVASVILATLWAAWCGRQANTRQRTDWTPAAGWLRVMAPGAVLGVLLLLGMMALPITNTDSASSLRSLDSGFVTFLLGDAGFPSLVHNLLRWCVGVDRSLVGTQWLNLVVFVVYAAACADLCARNLSRALAPWAATVAMLAPGFGRFHESRASVLMVTAAAVALALHFRSERRQAASWPMVLALGVATLDNPVYLPLFLLLAYVARPVGEPRRSWVGAAVLLAAGQAIPFVVMLREQVDQPHGSGHLLGYALWLIVLVAPVEALWPSRDPGVRRWSRATALVVVLGALVALAGAARGWKVVVAFWPLVVLAGVLGTQARREPQTARRIWVLAAGVALVAAVAEGPGVLLFDLATSRHLVAAVRQHVGPGEPVFVLPTHDAVELVTGGGLIDLNDVSWPLVVPEPYRAPSGPEVSASACVGPAGAVSWALMYRGEQRAGEGWEHGCTSCEVVDSYGPSTLRRCVSGGVVVPGR